jgi:hypothetical protein
MTFFRASQNSVDVLSSNTGTISNRISQNSLDVLYANTGTISSKVAQNYVSIIFYSDFDFNGPTSDIAVGNWGDVPLFSKINDENNTGTYITSSLTPTNDVMEVGFGDIENFGIINSVQLRYKFNKVDSSDVNQDDGDAIDITFELRENGSPVTGAETFTDIDGDNAIITSDFPKSLFPGNGQGLSVAVTANKTSSGVAARKAKIPFIVIQVDFTPVLDSSSPLWIINSSGLINPRRTIVNYPSTRGDRGIGWKNYGAIRQSGVISGMENLISNRFNNTSYYKGDSS